MRKYLFKAKRKAVNKDWDGIIDEYDTDELTVGYKVTDIWEIE